MPEPQGVDVPDGVAELLPLELEDPVADPLLLGVPVAQPVPVDEPLPDTVPVAL